MDDIGRYQVTLTRYVDNNRTDTYTADGSQAKPFKTIQAAIDSIIDAGGSKRYVVIIMAGNYTENVALKSFVYLQGAGGIGQGGTRLQGTVTGNFTANQSTRVCLFNLRLYNGISWTVAPGSTASHVLWIGHTEVNGAVTINGATRTADFLDSFSSIFWNGITASKIQLNLHNALVNGITAADADAGVYGNQLLGTVTLNADAYAEISAVAAASATFIVNAASATLDIDADSASGATINNGQRHRHLPHRCQHNQKRFNRCRDHHQRCTGNVAKHTRSRRPHWPARRER